jgi:hypothetical protein
MGFVATHPSRNDKDAARVGGTRISAKIDVRVEVFVFDSVRRERLRSHSIVGVLQQEGYEVSGPQ